MTSHALPFTPLDYYLGEYFTATTIVPEINKQDLDLIEFKEEWQTGEYIAALYAFYCVIEDIDMENISDSIISTLTAEELLKITQQDFKRLQEEGARFDLTIAESILHDSYQYWRASCFDIVPNYSVDYESNHSNHYFDHLRTIRSDLDNDLISIDMYCSLLQELQNKARVAFNQVDLNYYHDCCNKMTDHNLFLFNSYNRYINDITKELKTVEDNIERQKLINKLNDYQQKALAAFKHLGTN